MRHIVHLDADAFFASVEQAADPRLRGKPVAVGGERRGIIASASYEARRLGVCTPMPTARARKLCPGLIVLPGDFEKYERFSRWMFSYAYDFTPEVEQTSIDEGYFDLTANRRQSPLEIAQTIRNAIRQALKISVSEGIGSNKLVSQIASKLHKPAAFHQVPPGGEIAFLHPLPNHWLPGIGPKTAARLNAAGLAQIRHIAAAPLDWLELLLGSQARQIRQFANGVDDRPLLPACEPQQSFSQQETFAQDLTDEAHLEAVLRRMADRLFAKVRAEGKSIRTLTVKVRYNDMAEDQCSESLVEPTDLETDVYGRLGGMLRRAWKRRVSLRLVSLKLSNLYDGVFGGELALDRAAEQQQARERLARVVDELRRAKGATVLLRGHDFVLRTNPVQPLAETPKPETRDSKAVLNSAVRETDVAQAAQPVGSCCRGNGAEACTATARIRPAGLCAQESASQSPTPAPPSRLTAHVPQPRQAGTHSPNDQLSATAHRLLATDRRPLAIGNRLLAIGDRLSSLSPIPLRVHSYYSLLDSTLAPADLVRLAAQHGCSAVALTDFGNLHGAVEFTQAARQAGIQPILGAEIRVAGAPLLLYVESARGYANLCRLLSAAPRPSSPALENPDPTRRQDDVPAREQGDAEPHARSVAEFHRRDFDRATLACWADGLLAASPDVSLADLFPGRFYQLASPQSVGSRLPTVAAPAIHYATPADRLKFDILQSIRTRTLLRQAHPDKRLGGRFHFRTPGELARACRAHPDWLAHTRELADRCRFVLPLGKPQFPAFRTPDGSPPRAFLRRLALEGLHRRYAGRRIVSDTGAAVPLAQVRAQIETELAIIAEVGYEDLFLLTWDLLQTCRARGIGWITRGSAADSLVCYCLGISDVCPIRFGLYFRRFLNKERMALHKLPDIDVDFPYDRKDEVVDLLFARYGPDHCAVVGGFSTFQARSAVADVAKVLGVSEYQIRRFTEHFPWSFGGGWSPADEPRPRGHQLLDLLRASPECRDLPLDEEPFRTAVEVAAFLDGVPRHPKMHPCGLVLSRQPMHELTPTFRSNKGWPTTHFDMDAVEAVGLVKMDILAQGGLAVMRDTRALLAARGVQVDGERCTGNGRVPQAPPSCPPPHPPDLTATPDAPFHDPAVWAMIASGNARAVHHIESPAMTALCRMCNVRDIDGLIAIVSVIRPGAANEQKKVRFTRRYQGLEAPVYAHPSLEPCLRSTFGLVVYEEHILQICEAFAGLNPGRADVLRRALVKQHWAEVQAIAAEFAAAAKARGHSQETIREVWALVTGFHGYAFCKAHSTAYGVEAYQAAWLKCHFPAEFMAAVLTHGKGFYDPLVYVLECHRLGLPLLPPSVNEPGPGFVVTRNPHAALPAAGRTADCLTGQPPPPPRPAGLDTGDPAGLELCAAAPTRTFHSQFETNARTLRSAGFQPAVAPISNRQGAGRVRRSAGWKPAIQQTEKSALRSGDEISGPSQTADGHAAPCALADAPSDSGFRTFIRTPLTRVKGLTERTKARVLAERARGPFASLADFYRRVAPQPEELEAMIRVGALDEFGATRTAQFWEAQRLIRAYGHQVEPGQGWLFGRPDAPKPKAGGGETRRTADPLSAAPSWPPSPTFQPEAGGTLSELPPLKEPTRRERLEAENALLGFPVSGHPLELYADVAWETYCPVARLGEHVGETVVTCGLVVEQRVHHQVTGEPMKFLTLADWTGMVETELFAATYKSYGLATVRYPVLEITARVEGFENGRGFTLRVLRAGKPRLKTPAAPR